MSEEKRIYLVEDDPSMKMLLCTLLEMEGFIVIPWNTSEDPFEKIIENKPDIVFMDVNLRGHNGFDVLQEVRNSSDLSGMRVILSSGMDYSLESERARADAFLLKPFMPDDLISLIRTLVNSNKV